MARPKLTGPGAGPFAHTKDDPRRAKPSWFSLGGYFDRKGRGEKGTRTSSFSQQKVDKGNRGKRNGKTIS